MPDWTPTPLDGEFRVNTVTANDQSDSTIVALANGGFVIVWSSLEQDGSGSGIYGQRYDDSGASFGGQFRVNTFTTDSQRFSSVTALADGGFVVSWESSGQDGSSDGVYAQRYNSSGAAAGGEFRVNTFTNDDQDLTSIAALADGGFVISWSSSGQDGDSFGIYAQRYAASGAAVGGEFRVSTATVSAQYLSRVAGLTDGGFVITWTDSNTYEVYAQRYNSNGVAVGTEFMVNTQTAAGQFGSVVSALADGGYIISWDSAGQDGSSYGVYAQRYSSSGAAVGSEFRVNTTTANGQYSSSILSLKDGGFVISWMSNEQDGAAWGVYGQRFDDDGMAVGGEFRINQTTAGTQAQGYSAAIAELADGSLAFTWDGNGLGDS